MNRIEKVAFNKNVLFRISQNMLVDLLNAANEQGQTKSEFIRSCIRKQLKK